MPASATVAEPIALPYPIVIAVTHPIESLNRPRANSLIANFLFSESLCINARVSHRQPVSRLAFRILEEERGPHGDAGQ